MNYSPERNEENQRLGIYPPDWLVDRLKDKTILIVGGDWGDDPESDTDGVNTIVFRQSF